MTNRPPTASSGAVRRDNALILCGAVGFGLVPLFARPLMDAGLAPEAVALYRFVPGLLLTLPLLMRLAPDRVRRRQALWLVLSGASVGLSWVLYLHGLDRVPVAWAGTVYMSYPLFVIVIAWVAFRRFPAARSWGAAALVLLAAVFLVSGPMDGQGAEARWALLLCLPAPIAFAAMITLLVRGCRSLSSLERMGGLLSGTVLGLIPLLVGVGHTASLIPGSAAEWGWVLGLVALTAIGPQMIYTSVAPRVSEMRLSILGSVELPTMVLVAWWAFSETLGTMEVLSILCVVVATVLVPSTEPDTSTPPPSRGWLRPGRPPARSRP